jgi:hypothetical protein
MVRSELNSPCDVKGFEHLTKGQYGVRALVALYMQAVPWAVKEVHNRAFGRVPMNIELDVDVHHEHNDLDYMTTAELIAYTDVLKQKLEAHANRAAIDTTAAVVEPEPEAK